jgi:peptidase M28-like protein
VQEGRIPKIIASPADRDLARSVIERLETLPRLPTSPGEHEAAHVIDSYLASFGCRSRVEPARAHRSYALPIGLQCAFSAAATWLGGRGHRFLGAAGAALLALGIVDDISEGPMLFRRLFLRSGTTLNVVATIGDPDAATTLVVLAHHDASPSGLVFDQSLHEWLARTWPRLLDRVTTNPPLWWLVIGGPLLGALGSAASLGVLRAVGLVLSLGSMAAMIDIGRRPAVPGANDNLSGVAVLLVLARRFAQRPTGIRVMLVSAGAEEALQQGIRDFRRRHFAGLDPARTYFMNLDCVGSGRLVLLEGEGPIWMRDYDADLKDLTACCAARLGIDLVRGLRSRHSTDGVVPLRGGYPTVSIVSVDERKLMPHYHLNSDTLDNLDLRCVIDAADLAEAVARGLASPNRSADVQP